ncbi:MAG: DUF2341 domain-containing protein [Candidatus Bathyarchaeia archaeon]
MAETPKVIFQQGIVGASIIYMNDTSAKVIVNAASWLNGWKYRKRHVISRATWAGKNYQVWFNVYKGGGVDNGNSVYLNDHSQAVFPNDIRFTDDDGQTLLNYWIESYNSTWAKIWVKVADDLSTSDRAIYIYYGSPNANSISNFDATFTKNFEEGGLAGLWHMDEGMGTIASDSSGNSNNGVISGARWDTSDGGQWDGRADVKFSTGSALIFDGANDVVNCGRGTSLNIRSAIAIEAWIYPTGWGEDPNNGYGRIVDKTTYMLFLNKGTVQPRQNNLVFGLRINNNMYYGNTPTNSITLNTWHHIVAVYDTRRIMIYINGVSQTITYYRNQQPSGLIDDSSGYNLLIGDSPNSDRCFQGKIDEVRIYGRGVGAAEVRCHYERRKYAFPEPQHGEWGEEEIGGVFDYVLRAVNQVADSWNIRLRAYNQMNIGRLSNCTIYFYNDGEVSCQICIINGEYSQQFGSWYNLTGLSTAYIAVTVSATSTENTWLYAYLEILVPNTSTYNLMEVAFEIS